jgi:hypothetical protein
LPINRLLTAATFCLTVTCWVANSRGQSEALPTPVRSGAGTAGDAGRTTAAPTGSIVADTPALASRSSSPEDELVRTALELKALSQNQAQAKPGDGREVDRLKSQLEIQQKQIDVLLKMNRLLAEQVKQQPGTSAAVERLEEQAARQDARLNQAAQRDQELARAHDSLAEAIDAELRAGPQLPSTLREWFIPSRTNESPVTFYGLVDEDFYAFSKQNSTFRPPTLQLHPYVLLNERWLMSANVILLSSSLQICRMQAEWFINDNLTFVAGRFYSPIGFWTERIRLSWVNRLPDPPLMFNQVYPDNLFFDGLQFRGSRYLFNSPVKLEYVGFVANGLSVAGANLSPRIYSDLSNFTDTGLDVNGAKAYGGRVGFSIPRIGFIAGISGLANQAYDQANHNLSLWDIDANWHHGNWDARFELAKTDQQTSAQPIHRFGFYAQLAYRQYNSPNHILQKIESVFRFDHTQFDGINVQQTGINFGGYEWIYARMPLDRNRYTLGLNYWFTPSLALKLALEFYNELGVPSLRDNGFIGQITWGW